MGTDVFAQLAAPAPGHPAGRHRHGAPRLDPRPAPSSPFLVVGGAALVLHPRPGPAKRARCREPEPEERDRSARRLPRGAGQRDAGGAHSNSSWPSTSWTSSTPDGAATSSTGSRPCAARLALELGIVVPPVRTRDNLDLPASTYAIRLHGVEVARGQAPPACVLAIGDGIDTLPGSRPPSRCSGCPPRWVPTELRQQAELAGATVVDPPSVITTHLAEVVRTNAGRLLSRQDVKALVDLVKAHRPGRGRGDGRRPARAQRAPAGAARPARRGRAIRDLVRIFEVLSRPGQADQGPRALVEAARQSLGPAISAAHAVDGRLPVITFEPTLEHSLLEVLRRGDSGSFLALDASRAEAIVRATTTMVRKVEETGESPVLVCAAPLRSAIRRLTRSAIPQVPILSYAEIGSQLTIETMGVVTLVDATV